MISPSEPATRPSNKELRSENKCFFLDKLTNMIVILVFFLIIITIEYLIIAYMITDYAYLVYSERYQGYRIIFNVQDRVELQFNPVTLYWNLLKANLLALLLFFILATFVERTVKSIPENEQESPEEVFAYA